MANEYNGNLIAELFDAQNGDQAVKVLDEMDEILDLSFVAAIIAAFKKYRKTSKSHYFLSSLSQYRSSQAVDFLNALAMSPDSSEREFMWSLESLTNAKVNDPFAIERAKKFLKNEPDLSTWELEIITNYLKFTNQLAGSDSALLGIIFDGAREKDVRKMAFEVLLRLDPSKYLQYILDNEAQIKQNRSDSIIADTLITWKGALVQKVEELILRIGSDRAKEIINAKRSAAKKEETKTQEKKAQSTADEFANADVIMEINELKKAINLQTLGNAAFGFALLPNSDLLISIMRSAKSAPDVANVAISLRALITMYDAAISNHGLTFDQAKSIIPNIAESDMGAPLVQLQLFLHSRKITIPVDFFGLRKLNALPNKVAHPQDDAGFVEALKKNGLYESYMKSEWRTVQRQLLEIYKDSLIRLKQSLV